MFISGHPHIRPTRTLTRWPKLRKLFPAFIDTDVNARVARLCVLFEDLRIELIGIDLIASGVAEDSTAENHFDLAGYRLRRIYFLRRSIGTCWEFADALRLLDETKSFRPILAKFEPSAQANWAKSVQYFKQQSDFWKEIRNDVGGHFGEAAARFAVEHFLGESSGALEIQWDARSDSGECILGFASEIAATGLLRRLKEPSLEERTKSLFDRVVEAYGHAIIAVECLVLNYLWQRCES